MSEIRPRINAVRIAAAVLITGLAVLQGHWLLLLPAVVLAYQAYRGLTCAVCEAGFCDGWEEKEGKDPAG